MAAFDSGKCFRCPIYDVLSPSISVLLTLLLSQSQPLGTNLLGSGQSKSKSHASLIGGLVAGGIVGRVMIVAVMIFIRKRRDSRGEGVQLICDDFHCSTANRGSSGTLPPSSAPASFEMLSPNRLRAAEGGEYLLSPFRIITRFWSSLSLSALTFADGCAILQIRPTPPYLESSRERQKFRPILRTPRNTPSTETRLLSDMTTAVR